MIVTCEQMKQAEDRLFSTGVVAEDLMEKAGQACARAVRQFFLVPGKATLYVGRGNNGGMHWWWGVSSGCVVGR